MAEVDMFAEIIRSPATRQSYELALKQFREHADIVDLRALEPKSLQTKLIEYVVSLKQAKASYAKQNIAISAVQKFCEAYDIEVNFKKVRQYCGEQTATSDDRPYAVEELRRMVDAANPRLRAMILLMLSAGLRMGALPELKLKHIKKLENYGIYRVNAYADSARARYVTFTTPECAKAVDDYLQTRSAKGEELMPERPLFRLEFDKEKANSLDAKPITREAIKNLVQGLTVGLGIRKLGDRMKRQPTPLTQSFRKIFNTAFIMSGVPTIVAEILQGRKVGLQNNYTRLTDEQLLQEYLKAVDRLTVSNEKALRMEVEKLKVETQDMSQLKRNYLDMKLENEAVRQELAKIQESLDGTLAIQRQGLEEARKVEAYIKWLESRAGIKDRHKAKLH